MTTPTQGRTGEDADRALYDVPTQGVPQEELLADDPEDAAPAPYAAPALYAAAPPVATGAPAPYAAGDPRRRRALAGLGLVAAAVLGTAGGWALGSRGDAPPPRARTGSATAAQPSAAAPGAGATAGAAAGSGTPGAPAGAGRVEPARAAQRLAVGGATVRGDIQQAWSWTDGNGRNFLVLSKEVTRRDGNAVRAATLYVTHLAGRGDDRLEPLRRPLVDPGAERCASDARLDFADDSVRVTDADRDGIAEVSAGWWFSCGARPGPATLKLAVLTDGGRFILRGEGQLATAADPDVSVPPATFEPEPRDRSAWPRGTYDATVQLFGQLFR